MRLAYSDLGFEGTKWEYKQNARQASSYQESMRDYTQVERYDRWKKAQADIQGLDYITEHKGPVPDALRKQATVPVPISAPVSEIDKLYEMYLFEKQRNQQPQNTTSSIVQTVSCTDREVLVYWLLILIVILLIIGNFIELLRVIYKINH